MAKEMQLLKSQIRAEPQPKFDTIDPHHQLNRSEVLKISQILKTEEIVTLNLSGTNIFVDDLVTLSLGIRECPTLKHINLANNSNLFSGLCRDTRDSIYGGKLAVLLDLSSVFNNTTLETIALPGLKHTQPIITEFLNLINSQANSLKQIDISHSNLLPEEFESIFSGPALKTLVFKHGEISSNKLFPKSMEDLLKQVLSSNPSLTVHLNEEFVTKSPFVQMIGRFTFLSGYVSLENFVPNEIATLILEFIDLGVYSALSGDVFREDSGTDLVLSGDVSEDSGTT